MDEKFLLKIAFIGSLVGILALYFLINTLDYAEVSIEKINAERMQEMLKIKGEVQSVSNAGNVTFVTITQPSTIDVIVFDPIVLVKGEKIEIIGKGEEYNGEMEVIAHRIRVIE